MSFNSENKITLEELSPSLQNLLKSAASRTEMTELYNRTNKLDELLNNVRFTVVDDLSEILLPINGKDLAIAGTNGEYKLYFYFGDSWHFIPTAAIDLNREYLITMSQSAHQTITAEYNGAYYTTSFMAKVNNDVKVTLVADTNYIAGELNCSEIFSVIGPTTISATPATQIPKYNITVTPSSHQNIEVTYNGRTYVDTSVSGLPEKSLFSVDIHAEYGWNAGELNVSEYSSYQYGSIYTILGNTTISANPATRKNYTITIPGTENQKITFRSTNSSTGEVTNTEVTSLTKTITLPFESTYTVSAIGLNGYLPGTLSTTEGTITADMSVTISAAKKTYNKELFDSPGTYSWTAPSYISKVHVILAGAGGGAHQETIEEGTQSTGYFNGGNGELIDTKVTITPSQTYQLVVGKAGTTFVSSGGASTAFGISANGGSLDGTDAGNGKGGKGDTINYLTGYVLMAAENGYITLEYGTNIEQEEVNP